MMRFSCERILIGCIGLLISTSAYAVGEECTVRGLDSIAGLGTEITVTNCISNKSGTLAIIKPNGERYTQSIGLDSKGDGSTIVPSNATTIAGDYTVQFGPASSLFSVLADKADDARSSLSASPLSLQGEGTEHVTVTAVLRDRFDNPVNGASIALLSSRPQDIITSVSSSTDATGRFVWKVQPREKGTMTLIPYDVLRNRQLQLSASVQIGGTSSFFSPWKGSLIGNEQGGDNDAPSATANINPQNDRVFFELSLPQNATQVKTNELFSMNIRAMRGTEVIRSYIGTLIVESTDTDAELPKKGEDPVSPQTGRIDMRNVDQGERKVPLSFSFRKQGKQTIRVFDKNDPTLQGEIVLTVGGNGAEGEDVIRILSPVDGSHIPQSSSIRLQGKAPSFINLRVKGGKEIVVGESDAEGVFRIDVPLHPDYKEVTLFVTSENGAYESNPVHLILDAEGPKIMSATINPAEAKVGESALLVVNADAGIPSMIATLGKKEVILSASGSSQYIGTITAPEEVGKATVTIVAKDQVGNSSSLMVQWNIVPKTLPMITGVRAESQMGKVALSWDAVTTLPVKEYRIYIAKKDEPLNMLFSLQTGKPMTSAVIGNLPLGVTYLFYLTAIGADGTEGTEKSLPVSASPLGMNVTATAKQNSVLLEWNAIAGISIAEYILEFGTEAGVYTEKRTIDGKALATTVRDLLSGVTYEFRLTPIAITGKTLKDYQSTVRARVLDGSFLVGASDPAPLSKLPPVTLHNGAPILQTQWEDVPRVTSSGISSLLLIALGIVTLFIGWFIVEERREQKILREYSNRTE